MRKCVRFGRRRWWWWFWFVSRRVRTPYDVLFSNQKGFDILSFEIPILYCPCPYRHIRDFPFNRAEVWDWKRAHARTWILCEIPRHGRPFLLIALMEKILYASIHWRFVRASSRASEDVPQHLSLKHNYFVLFLLSRTTPVSRYSLYFNQLSSVQPSLNLRETTWRLSIGSLKLFATNIHWFLSLVNILGLAHCTIKFCFPTTVHYSAVKIFRGTSRNYERIFGFYSTHLFLKSIVTFWF